LRQHCCDEEAGVWHVGNAAQAPDILFDGRADQTIPRLSESGLPSQLDGTDAATYRKHVLEAYESYVVFD
jgi:hypothetical protein